MSVPGGRLDGAELHHRLAHRLGREPLPAILLEEEIEADTPAAAEAADLPLAILLDDDRDVEPGERADIADRPARGPGDHDHDVLAADGGDDLAHPRIERARRRVHLVEQAHLAAEIGGERSLRQRVEVVGLAHGPDRDHRGRPRLIGDGAGLPRRFLQIRQGQVVGVRVARALARLGPDARALAHVPGGLLHRRPPRAPAPRSRGTRDRGRRGPRGREALRPAAAPSRTRSARTDLRKNAQGAPACRSP